MQITQYIEYDDYEACLLTAEGNLSGEEALMRTEMDFAELVTSDVLLALSVYMPEVSSEWIMMLFLANREHNIALALEKDIQRTELGWLYANLVIDLHRKTGTA